MINSQYLAKLLPLILIATVAAIHWPGLSGQFLFDDYPNIVTNARVQPQALDWASIKSAARGYEPGAIGRPLATVGFAFDYWLGGKNPWGYKFHSLLVHLVNALLVFALLRRLLDLAAFSRGATNVSAVAAFSIALIWAIHPLQISTVLYVVQRMETLSLTFVLLGLLAYLRGRSHQREGRSGWIWLALSGALAAIALLSKESAALFPLYTLGLELSVLRFAARDTSTSRFLRYAYGFGIVTALAAYCIFILPTNLSSGPLDGRNFSMYERVLSQMRILPMYIGQMILPLPQYLTFYYDDYPVSTGWLSPPTTLLGALFLAGLLVLAWMMRVKNPLFSLGVFWFFAAHAITSNVLNLELVFEHRNYFALLGVLLALASLIARIPSRNDNTFRYLAVGVFAATFAFLASMRAATWGQELNLATELVSKNPQSARASSDLATLYGGMAGGSANSPFYGFAIHEFERGSRLPNASPLPEHGMILLAASVGAQAQDIWWDQLIEKVRTRPISPQEISSVTGIMRERLKGLKVDDARLSEAYAALLKRVPRPEFFAQYGDYAVNTLKDEEIADRAFAAAIEHSSDDPAYAQRIYRVLMSEGHIRQAKVVAEKARLQVR
jgi:hypothetical protein